MTRIGIGSFSVIVAATMLTRASDVRRVLSEFDSNMVSTWVMIAIALLTGLFVIGYQ